MQNSSLEKELYDSVKLEALIIALCQNDGFKTNYLKLLGMFLGKGREDLKDRNSTVDEEKLQALHADHMRFITDITKATESDD